MNIVEMKMYDEYLKSLIQENSHTNIKNPSHEDKQNWLKNNIDYNTIVEYALDNPTIISILYDHFKK